MTARRGSAIDTRRGKVTVYSRNADAVAKVENCLRRDMRLMLRDYTILGPDAPVDFYIVASLSATVEREAARHKALPVVLPAATVWLAAKVDEITAGGKDVAIMMRRVS